MDPTTRRELTLPEKEEKLAQLLTGCGKALVAFSGGADSTFLLHRAVSLLGAHRVLAVTAASPIRAAAETEAACALAAELAAPHRLLRTAELSRKPFLENRPDRCYHCKEELCRRLGELSAAGSFDSILDGANFDDLAEYRPGTAAARACGIRSPLQEAALSKAEIRLLSRRDRLPTWNRPAESCLATRFPYGEKLEQAKLARVEQAELYLRSLGLRQEIRVRSRGDSARIEVVPAELALLWENRAAVSARLRKSGFTDVAVDLEGYSPGRADRGREAPDTAAGPR